MTPLETIAAIRARVDGVWDDPALQKLGPLMPDTLSDIQRLLDMQEEPDIVPKRVRVVEIELAVPEDCERWQDTISNLCHERPEILEWRQILTKENLIMTPEEAAVRFEVGGLKSF